MSLTRKLLGAVALRWSLMILGGKMRERCGMRALERVGGPSGFSLLGGCQHWRPSPSLCETVSIRLGPLINCLVLGAKVRSCGLQVWRCVLAFPPQVPFKQAKLTRSSRLVLNPCQFARQWTDLKRFELTECRRHKSR